MKVIIAGSRHINDKNALSSLIEHSGWDIEEVVSGGCRGVDVMGEEWAAEHSIPVRTFAADWARYGREAGELRNREMAKYADGLILLWDAKSPGSSCMLREGSKAGIQIQHRVEGLNIEDMAGVEQTILNHILSGKGRLVLQHEHWEWETADTEAPTVCQEAVTALIQQELLEEAKLTILRPPVSETQSAFA
jgi:hypothetical protein